MDTSDSEIRLKSAALAKLGSGVEQREELFYVTWLFNGDKERI